MSKHEVKREGWFKVALDAIEAIAIRQRFLTVDDLRRELAGNEPKSPNDYGAVWNAAAHQEKLIVATRRHVKSSHPAARRRMVPIWESTFWITFGQKNEDLEAFILEREGGEQGAML